MEYKISGKYLLDYFNLFPPNDYQKNDKIIYKYKYGKRKCKTWLDFLKLEVMV